MPAHFGLDISSSTIKVAEVTPSKDSYALKAFGEVKTPAPIQSPNPQDLKFNAGSIKKLLTDAKISSRNVSITIPDSESFTRVIEMPVLSKSELVSALEFESEQYVPFPIDQVYLEHQVLMTPPNGSPPDVKMKVLLVAAKKDVVDRVVRVVELAGLTPVYLETALLSAIRGLKYQLNENSLLVDAGNSSTDVGILMNGMLKQISSIPTAGLALTRSIAQNLALSQQQATQYKHVYGLDKSQLQGKVAVAMQQPMTSIVNHIVKSIRFANSTEQTVRVQEVVLSGGTALLPGLTHYLVEQLNIEVVLANPFQKCTNNNLPQQLVAAAPRFASAIGAALRD